jgi:hypothetical protein
MGRLRPSPNLLRSLRRPVNSWTSTPAAGRSVREPGPPPAPASGISHHGELLLSLYGLGLGRRSRTEGTVLRTGTSGSTSFTGSSPRKLSRICFFSGSTRMMRASISWPS